MRRGGSVCNQKWTISPPNWPVSRSASRNERVAGGFKERSRRGNEADFWASPRCGDSPHVGGNVSGRKLSLQPPCLVLVATGMKSMTGYGWGERAEDGFKVTVELSSVNRKQSEISVILPRELEVLEAQIRDEVNRRIARGRLTARVSLHMTEGKDAARAHLNRELAHAYARELTRLAKELNLAGAVSLDVLMRAHGVVQN